MIKFILTAYSFFKEHMAVFYIVPVLFFLIFAFLEGKMQCEKEISQPYYSTGAFAYEKI